MLFGVMEIYEAEIPGHGPVKYDPLAVRRRLLQSTSGRCWEMFRDARNIELDLQNSDPKDESEVAVATRAELSVRLATLEGGIADAGYEAFGLSPIDSETGGGSTEAAVLDITKKYLEWVETKKATAEISRTS